MKVSLALKLQLANKMDFNVSSVSQTLMDPTYMYNVYCQEAT